MQEAFLTGTFETPASRRGRFCDSIRAHVDAQARLRVLDLGCGAGGQLMELADLLPNASLMGFDTSSQNVERATARALARRDASRIMFRTLDFLDYEGPAFDLVVSDSVLQNIDVHDRTLYAKLAKDVALGGLLIVTMPYACIYNHALWFVRRVARRLRSSVIERLVLALASRMHPSWDVSLLRERLPYLFMVPHRYDSARMRKALTEEHGFRMIQRVLLEHASIAQPKHVLIVYKRT